MHYLKLSLIGILIFISGAVKSQVSVNINIGTAPDWGPVGYSEARYYYLPDVEAYYDVQSSMFIYFGDGVWLHRAYLPGVYRNYDLYGGYKVVMVDYHGDKPYHNFKEYKVKYKKGYHGPSQKTIGNKPGKTNTNLNSSKQPSGQTQKKNSAVQQKSGSGNSKHNSGAKQNHGGGHGKK